MKAGWQAAILLAFFSSAATAQSGGLMNAEDRSGVAFEVIPSEHNDRYQTLVRYADSGVLRSGRLVGEEHIAGKPAMILASVGQGEVVLIGFRTQHRGQTHGTFKLLFNALLQ